MHTGGFYQSSWKQSIMFTMHWDDTLSGSREELIIGLEVVINGIKSLKGFCLSHLEASKLHISFVFGFCL